MVTGDNHCMKIGVVAEDHSSYEQHTLLSAWSSRLEVLQGSDRELAGLSW